MRNGMRIRKDIGSLDLKSNSAFRNEANTEVNTKGKWNHCSFELCRDYARIEVLFARACFVEVERSDLSQLHKQCWTVRTRAAHVTHDVCSVQQAGICHPVTVCSWLTCHVNTCHCVRLKKDLFNIISNNKRRKKWIKAQALTPGSVSDLRGNILSYTFVCSFSLSCSDVLSHQHHHHPPSLTLGWVYQSVFQTGETVVTVGWEITPSVSPCGRSSICFCWELRIWALKALSDACASKWELEDKGYSIKTNEEKSGFVQCAGGLMENKARIREIHPAKS